MDTSLSRIFTFKVTEQVLLLDAWIWEEDVDPPAPSDIVPPPITNEYDPIIAMEIMKMMNNPKYAFTILDRWFKPIINKNIFIDINSLHS